ncbi:MAG: M23 family metallopeptidase [Alphaproteobacteria bacterium]|nr:M23 family metallopeptidase [Alphaproteobacteria bacterium]
MTTRIERARRDILSLRAHRTVGILLACVLAAVAARGAEPPQLSLPIDCRLGETCFVQNYVDVDPGPGAQDYICGGATYNGHKGTDFRVLSAAATEGVFVLAAADGKVLRGRDSMPDRLLRDYASKVELKSIVGENQCGNGLIIDHGGGWTTQYCHLKHGSIAVRPGQMVKAGDRLGTVGYSGTADFAHVHLTVRHDDVVVDPFLGRVAAAGTACDAKAQTSEGLWRSDLRERLGYGRYVIFDAGFAGTPPDNDEMERDHQPAVVRADSPALLFYARMINLKAGDRISVAVDGPQGFRAANTTKPLDRNKAVQMIYAGKKLVAKRWPEGIYKGSVSVLRQPAEGGAAVVVAERRIALQLR